MTTRYAERFQQPADVAHYDAAEYGAESYSSHIWHWQRPVVEQVVKNFRAEHAGPVRLLDFACGTGRVLSALEPLVDTADGVDISANMVAVARGKCAKARLLVGDVLAQPELLAREYDLISCFRFLLNVEPELRGRVLRKLREVLRPPDGLLLVNVHGNSRSLRHPAIAWRHWRQHDGQTDAMLNEMSPAAAKRLLAESGFEIVRQFGFGMLPPTFYRTPLRRAAAALDGALAGEHFWSDFAIDLLFVCRPR
jgi:SAM-dependent methyltransferase